VREGEQGERKVELKEETVVCRLAVGLHWLQDVHMYFDGPSKEDLKASIPFNQHIYFWHNYQKWKEKEKAAVSAHHLCSSIHLLTHFSPAESCQYHGHRWTDQCCCHCQDGQGGWVKIGSFGETGDWYQLILMWLRCHKCRLHVYNKWPKLGCQ
jgi:hypothetical protein